MQLCGGFSCVQLFATLWTDVHRASMSMGFSRQECCSGLPFPPQGDLPNPGIKPMSAVSPTLAGRFFTTEPPEKPPKWYESENVSFSVNPTLCNPMDYSPSGSSVHGIFQARILEWIAISSSRRSSQSRNQTCVSYIGRLILYHWATRKPRLWCYNNF